MKKKKPIKIKHRKYSLYQRKKSKGRRALTVVLMIVIVAALCVLGYGLGKPLVDYFQNRGSESEPSSAWTPPISAETSGASSEGTENSTAEPTSEPEPEAKSTGVFILPETALQSSDSLNSALAAAKNSGCSDVAVTLKDETGYFLYKTTITGVTEEQIKGSLTAKQIASIITSAGFTPRARINTLLDRTTKTYGDKFICYMISDGGVWHDNYVDKGGKSWLDPFEPATAKFLAAVTGELANAGFSSVILANTKYPAFHDLDYSTFLNHMSISDEAARLTALWNVISSCGAAAGSSGAELLLEMSDDEIFSNTQEHTSAEVIGDKTKLKTVTLLIDYTPEGKTGYTDAKAFIGRISAMYSGQSFAVRIQASGFSTSVLEDIRRAFYESGITVYSE